MSGSTPDFDGVLLIDKPQGLTSHDVVDRLRRKLRMKRIGHAGTLDPNATGLLIMLVGRATKLSQFLMSLDKTYTGTIRLGQTTDSHDSDGTVMEERAVPDLSEQDLQQAFQDFVGDQYQTPPMFSAKKVQGKPLYKLAHQGKEIEREPRFIRVDSFSLEAVRLPELDFRIRCSKGTYVRTIAHDLGEKLGCGAHLSALCRVSIERFDLGDALTLEAFEDAPLADIQRRLIPAYRAVPSSVLK